MYSRFVLERSSFIYVVLIVLMILGEVKAADDITRFFTYYDTTRADKNGCQTYATDLDYAWRESAQVWRGSC